MKPSASGLVAPPPPVTQTRPSVYEVSGTGGASRLATTRCSVWWSQQDSQILGFLLTQAL
jgi:hypothetical protein